MQPIADGTRNGCPVEARFASGRAVRLITVWGGACGTAEGVMVGLPLGTALSAYGRPAEAARDTTYYAEDGTVQSTAIWVSYSGIAFRAVVPTGWPASAGVITAIAVFR